MLGMSVHPDTISLVRRDAELLSRGAAERNREEFLKILSLDNASQIIIELDDLGLLTALVPELAAARGCTQSPPHTFDVLKHSIQTVKEIEFEQRADYADIAGGKFASELKAHFESDIASEHSRRVILRLSGLFHDIGKPATRTVESDGRIRFIGHEDLGADISEAILRRLRFSNAEIELVRAAVKHHLRPLQLSQHSPISNRAIYRFFRDTGVTGLDVCVHAWADQQAKSEGKDAAIDGTLEELFSAFFDSHRETITPAKLVDGRDIMSALHLPPGRRVGEILNAVKEAQVEGEIRDRAQALEWIKRYGDK
jgi:putative nucleotidyltransferase with HDIG domain